jgi:hypothetical protein
MPETLEEEDRMDSLKLQDVFEPYYAGRKRVSAPRDKSQLAEGQDEAIRREAGKRLLRRVLAEARIETDTESTTEH